jgi:hypothetical protein
VVDRGEVRSGRTEDGRGGSVEVGALYGKQITVSALPAAKNASSSSVSNKSSSSSSSTIGDLTPSSSASIPSIMDLTPGSSGSIPSTMDLTSDSSGSVASTMDLTQASSGSVPSSVGGGSPVGEVSPGVRIGTMGVSEAALIQSGGSTLEVGCLDGVARLHSEGGAIQVSQLYFKEILVTLNPL